MYVHNSSTTFVDKMYDFPYPYKENENRLPSLFADNNPCKFLWKKSVQRNLTCNTSERKTRDFYTIQSGCPQN
jgi:hypothetical protein